jgi:hypothetical protein
MSGEIRRDGVDTKCFSCATFGNDGGVDTKSVTCDAFGNDGFIRVRKRKLTYWRRYYASDAKFMPKASWSFDLVKAVRVDGKPRHRFALGFGSLKDKCDSSDVVRFWMRAVRRMVRHGITEERRRSLVAEMVRKGARWPTATHCREFIEVWPEKAEGVEEIMALRPRGSK